MISSLQFCLGTSAGLFLFLALAKAEEQPPTGAGEITGEARLLGDVADGTPPPPPVPPLLPDFEIEDSMLRRLPDCKATVRLVEDPGLPPLPPAPEPPTAEQLVEWEAWKESPEGQAFLAEAQDWARTNRFAMISATVYDRERTHVRWGLPGKPERGTTPRNFEAWSNVDFLYLGGFWVFEYEGIRYSLLMLAGATDAEHLERGCQLAAEHGVDFHIPEIPELPEGPPAYIVTKGDPTDEDGLALMDGLHALYAKEENRLIQAYESREQARIELKACLKANPPKPKDLILNFWRGKRSQPQHGGAE